MQQDESSNRASTAGASRDYCNTAERKLANAECCALAVLVVLVTFAHDKLLWCPALLLVRAACAHAVHVDVLTRAQVHAILKEWRLSVHWPVMQVGHAPSYYLKADHGTALRLLATPSCVSTDLAWHILQQLTVFEPRQVQAGKGCQT